MSDLTAKDRDILRAVFGRARDKILEVLSAAGAGKDERAKAIVALAELGAAIEGVPAGPACPMCSRQLEDHTPREVHDCAVEARARKLVEAVRVAQTPVSALYSVEDDELPANVIPVEFRGAVRVPRDLLNIPSKE